MRVQCYPEPVLEEKLRKEAEKKGISISALVLEILNQYYGPSEAASLGLNEYENKIFSEIQDYLKTADISEPFTLDVSKTYASTGKTKEEILEKARAGKHFRKLIGTEPFANVRRLISPTTGKPAFAPVTRAALFEVIEIKKE